MCVLFLRAGGDVRRFPVLFFLPPLGLVVLVPQHQTAIYIYMYGTSNVHVLVQKNKKTIKNKNKRLLSGKNKRQ
jgi:hypothetical protein